MVKLDPIRIAFDKLPAGIKNTARYYKEGRNILIRCLCRNSKRREAQVLFWLMDNNIEIKDLDKYGRE